MISKLYAFFFAGACLCSVTGSTYGYIYAIRESDSVIHQLNGSEFVAVAPGSGGQQGTSIAAGGGVALVIDKSGSVRRWNSTTLQFDNVGYGGDSIFASGGRALMIQNNEANTLRMDSEGVMVNQGHDVVNVYFGPNNEIFHIGTGPGHTIRRYQGNGINWVGLGVNSQSGPNKAATTSTEFVFMRNDGVLRQWTGGNSETNLAINVQSVYSDGSAIFVIDSASSAVRRWQGGVGSANFIDMNFSGGTAVELFGGTSGLFAKNEANQLYYYNDGTWLNEGITVSNLVFDTNGGVYALIDDGAILFRENQADWTTLGVGYEAIYSGDVSFVPESGSIAVLFGAGSLLLLFFSKGRGRKHS